jgi:hypothetical protein
MLIDLPAISQLTHSTEIDDIVFEVDCSMITIKPGADVDIGANPSAEEADEGLEEGAVTVNNVVHSFRLHSTVFDKKSFLTYLKASSISNRPEMA